MGAGKGASVSRGGEAGTEHAPPSSRGLDARISGREDVDVSPRERAVRPVGRSRRAGLLQRCRRVPIAAAATGRGRQCEWELDSGSGEASEGREAAECACEGLCALHACTGRDAVEGQARVNGLNGRLTGPTPPNACDCLEWAGAESSGSE